MADDWVIVDPNGEIIDKARFLGVIKSGTLTHEPMESEDMIVRNCGDSAVVSALAKLKGEIPGTRVYDPGTSDRCFCEAKWTLAMRLLATYDVQ